MLIVKYVCQSLSHFVKSVYLPCAPTIQKTTCFEESQKSNLFCHNQLRNTSSLELWGVSAITQKDGKKSGMVGEREREREKRMCEREREREKPKM